MSKLSTENKLLEAADKLVLKISVGEVVADVFKQKVELL